jgi:stage V sporulation protein B
MLFLPKKIKISKNDFSIKNDNLKKVLNISLPTTGSRLIGNIGYFLEPIILTFVLSNIYTNKFIVTEYGILNGYVMPILLLPSFFTMAISQALIPIISNYWSKNNNKMVLRKIKQAIFYSLIIGIPATLIFMFIPQVPMKLIYNTTDGIAYIKVLAPICLFHYIQSPLTSALQAMGLAKEAMNGTLIGMIIRTICLFVLSYLHIGLWGLVIATSINIIVVTIHQMIKIKNVLKK